MADTPTWEDENIPQPSSGEEPEDEGLEPEGEEPETEGGEGPKDRSAKARIQELLAKNKELVERLEKVEVEQKRVAPIPPTGLQPQPSPEVVRAVEQLKKLGFVQKDELDSQMRGFEERLILNTEHERMDRLYTGEDGRPKYDRVATEHFMREKGIYDPEIAYKALHEQELLDWSLKASQRKTRPVTAPPSAPQSGRGEGITREKIRQMQGTPEWKEWYETHRDEVLGMMQKGELS